MDALNSIKNKDINSIRKKQMNARFDVFNNPDFSFSKFKL